MDGIYDILGSGMSANKQWLEVTANNITNINTTRTKEGGPYHRQSVMLESKSNFDNFLNDKIGSGVKVDKVVEDREEKIAYNPEHPDANEEGYVRMPAINMVAEMSNMMMAQRAYEASVSTLNAMKKANEKTYEIGRI